MSNYIVIQDWMITDLNLKSNELIVYAIIYGFSQDGESTFEGSQKYIAKWCGSSTRTVRNALNSLLEKCFIYRIEYKKNGVVYSAYRARIISKQVEKFSRGRKNDAETKEKISSQQEKFSKKEEKFSDNNIDNIFILKEKINKKEKIASDEDENKRFKIPTVEEISSYCRSRNNKIDPQRFFDFYESKGWMVGKNKMKDWKASVRTWESKYRESNRSIDTYECV